MYKHLLVIMCIVFTSNIEGQGINSKNNQHPKITLETFPSVKNLFDGLNKNIELLKNESIKKKSDLISYQLETLRPYTIYDVRENNQHKRYMFHNNVLIGFWRGKDAHNPFWVLWHPSGNVRLYGELIENSSQSIHFDKEGNLILYLSKNPLFRKRSTIIHWNEKGEIIPYEYPTISINNSKASITTYESWRLKWDYMFSLEYLKPPMDFEERQIASWLTDPMPQIYFTSTRQQLEKAVALKEKLLPHLENTSEKWTNIDPYRLPTLARYFSFTHTQAIEEQSKKFLNSDGENLHMLGLAGMAGHGKLKDYIEDLEILEQHIQEFINCDHNKVRHKNPTLVQTRAQMAVITLGATRNLDAAPILIEALKGESWKLPHAEQVCDALGDIQYTEAINILRDLLVNNDFPYPETALRTLIRLGDKEAFSVAINALERINEENNEIYGRNIHLAFEMESLTGCRFLTDSSAWRNWWNEFGGKWVPPLFPEDINQ